jgi:hypothetical protein
MWEMPKGDTTLMKTISIPVYVVGRHDPDGVEILSAWPDEYHARYEADRWSQDSKVTHEYIKGILVIPAEGTPDAD